MSTKQPLPADLEKRVKSCPVDFKRVESFMKRAKKDLFSARLISNQDTETAYALLYNCMLHTGLACMSVSGVYPDIKGKHKTIIDYVAHSLGRSYGSQIKFYDRMRKRRHQFIYEPGSLNCTEKEMQEAEKVAEEFLSIITKRIKEISPQKELEL